uniref:Uncharacterized protein n=1 Tax=Oryza meridionalis TaxID=40149 RepID=A0A0E0CP53_9ORYZ
MSPGRGAMKTPPLSSVKFSKKAKSFHPAAPLEEMGRHDNALKREEILENVIIAGLDQGWAKFSLAARRLQNHRCHVDAPSPSTFVSAWALHRRPLPGILHVSPRYAGLLCRRPRLLAPATGRASSRVAPVSLRAGRRPCLLRRPAVARPNLSASCCRRRCPQPAADTVRSHPSIGAAPALARRALG